jgi:IMP dehydrogenase/GMP reductase
MVGNIANPETYRWYAENDCVDYIRVGIGNGGGCLTTKQSGVGHPMASLIYETYHVKQRFIESNNINIKNQNTLLHTKPVKVIPAIVADGGMKDYSDVIKALALGADYVMLGSIFNKALESAGKNYLYRIKLNHKFARYFYDKGYPVKKHFRGMSTKEAQKAMGKTQIKTSEGVVRYRRVEYHLNGWVENFEHYLRNAMSYSNTKTLNEFIGKADFCQITKSAYDRFNK